MAVEFEFGVDGSRFTRGLEKMRGQTNRWSSSMSKTIAQAFAGGLVIAGIKKLIDSASDLAETVQKSRVIFGQSSAEVEAWAASLASSFGISKQAALEASSSFASMFNILGVGQKESETMGKALVELASDMASFHNTSVEQAIRAIGSGLRGEMEPLRKFNVLLNEATLKEEAFKLGLFEGKGALDLSSRAQAAYNLILQQSEVASGDFARTSDGLANSMRILAAESENASAQVGGKMLPAITQVTAKLKGAASVAADWVMGFIVGFEGIVAASTQALIEIKDNITSIARAIDAAAHGHFNAAARFMSQMATRGEGAADRVKNAWKSAMKEAASSDLGKPAGEAFDGSKSGITASEREAANAKLKEQAKLTDKIAAAQERLNKVNKAALIDKRKIERIDREKKAVLEGIHDIAPTGSQEELENINSMVKFMGLLKEKETVEKRIDSAKKRKDKEAADIQARIDAPFKDLAPAETGIIASSLASIGGGGNVASFTSDPVLAAQLESNKILEEIKRNTQPNVAAPTIPEL